MCFAFCGGLPACKTFEISLVALLLSKPTIQQAVLLRCW
jgi:hypothetical protein